MHYTQTILNTAFVENIIIVLKRRNLSQITSKLTWCSYFQENKTSNKYFRRQ